MIKKFKNFVKENLEPQWKPEMLDDLLDKLEHLMDHAIDMIKNLGFGEELDDKPVPEDLITILLNMNTEESINLAYTIDELLDMLAEFEVESELEISRLN
jgi:hypothetical protein